MTAFSQNIVLIGMPGAGKSTVGVLLAKMRSMGFIDTDLVVQSGEGQRLQDLIDARGVEAFRIVEERYASAVEASHCVVATGGSVVYSEQAMAHLKRHGFVVFLDLALEDLAKRLTNLPSRGLVRFPGQSLEDLFHERRPLYLRYADAVVQCGDLSHEGVARAVIDCCPRRDHQ